MASDSAEQQLPTTFHGWKYSHYFKVVEEGNKNIRVHCTLCLGNKTLSSSRNTTSNFKTHLARVHKKAVLVVKEVPQANERRPKRKKVSDDQQPEASQAKKQCILSSNSVPSTRLHNLLSQ